MPKFWLTITGAENRPRKVFWISLFLLLIGLLMLAIGLLIEELICGRVAGIVMILIAIGPYVKIYGPTIVCSFKDLFRRDSRPGESNHFRIL